MANVLWTDAIMMMVFDKVVSKMEEKSLSTVLDDDNNDDDAEGSVFFALADFSNFFHVDVSFITHQL
jgi:hypothetical protein